MQLHEYFCENVCHQYHIACAGSPFGELPWRKPSSFLCEPGQLADRSMTFMEFLLASIDEVAKYLETVDTIEPIPMLSLILFMKNSRCHVTGGMLESILMWGRRHEDHNCHARKPLSGSRSAYRAGFLPNIVSGEFRRRSLWFWKSIPSQLARENKKFIYHKVVRGRTGQMQ